jgi:hypothetical protein
MSIRWLKRMHLQLGRHELRTAFWATNHPIATNSDHPEHSHRKHKNYGLIVLPGNSRETVAQMAVAEPYILHRSGPEATQRRADQARYDRGIESYDHSPDSLSLAPIFFPQLIDEQIHSQPIKQGI